MALDRFALYERAVQCPEHEVSFFRRVFRRARGREPLTLREDFSGTAAVSAAWVESGPDKEAWAVDHDEDALAWARANHVPRLAEDARKRLHLVHDDVRSVAEEPVDIVAAENFSWCLFKTRPELGGYLEVARENLNDEGALILDVQGGPWTQGEGMTERREIDDGFVMEWFHERFDPVTHTALYRMSFEVNGERLEDAFTYDFRHWTLPEVLELCHEAGFEHVETWWQHEGGKRSGTYRRVREAPAEDLWVAYVVALR